MVWPSTGCASSQPGAFDCAPRLHPQWPARAKTGSTTRLFAALNVLDATVWRFSQLPGIGMFVAAMVVENDVEQPAGWDGTFDGLIAAANRGYQVLASIH